MLLEKYVNSGSIRPMYKILHSWTDIVVRYLEYFYYNDVYYNDVPWLYNERATLSTLAAAVWAAGDIALEEYSIEKGKKKADRFKGRCDLYMGIGLQEFACEAKQAWCNISPKATKGCTKVESGLHEARLAVREIPKDNNERRLGICFAVPYLHERYEKEGIERHIENWLSMIRSLDYSSIAWVFPKKARHLRLENGNYFPGIVLLVKEL